LSQSIVSVVTDMSTRLSNLFLYPYLYLHIGITSPPALCREVEFLLGLAVHTHIYLSISISIDRSIYRYDHISIRSLLYSKFTVGAYTPTQQSNLYPYLYRSIYLYVGITSPSALCPKENFLLRLAVHTHIYLYLSFYIYIYYLGITSPSALCPKANLLLWLAAHTHIQLFTSTSIYICIKALSPLQPRFIVK